MLTIGFSLDMGKLSLNTFLAMELRRCAQSKLVSLSIIFLILKSKISEAREF